MNLRFDHLGLLTDTREKNQDIADVEEIRGRGGKIALEPIETDWGTTTAYVAGPHGVLVEIYKMN